MSEAHARRAVELHDSTLAAVSWHGAVAVLQLRPAYVHRWEPSDRTTPATGWAQDVDIVIGSASVVGGTEITRISDGSVSCGRGRWDNLLPIPLRADSGVMVHLLGVNGATLEASGDYIELVHRSEPRYLEVSPWDGAYLAT